MLKRMSLYASHRPVEVVRFWRDENYLDLNATYQRGDVWGNRRRVNLIRSILLGIPIPSIIINDRDKARWDDGDYSVVVIDGKQRITSILMFLDSELAVPAEWFGETGAGDTITFSRLQMVNQRRFRNSTLAFSEGALPDLASEKEVFDLVNFGGVPQGESDE
ncbi:Domain of unknown function DUF262 [uncultured Caudovirales phage]|uniref:GmrSD restriction endonucleases N-terminal domain-containing protein n=1 Tax=uncultured Caudovirales phage TaxID=2100421 RepID=A0A6J5RE02_9CAUD|nr:Domain of unknown function DUF262 [uncultured Caudovirales phage]